MPVIGSQFDTISPKEACDSRTTTSYCKITINLVKYMLFAPEACLIVMPILLVLELLVLKVIVNKVAYTEIDYKAYMEQIWKIQGGERNYTMIYGGTGPLVYPAGHTLIYGWMERVSKGIADVKAGQDVFVYLYLVSLVAQFGCYILLELPPWCVALACISKRLHSIYVLRLFNDCWTTLAMSVCVFLTLLGAKYPDRSKFCSWMATLSYAVATSVKMNALLYLPGFLLCLFLLNKQSLLSVASLSSVIVGWHVFVAREFLDAYPLEYLQGAFDFSRQFLYQWTVNWQMVGQEVFEDPLFHRTLLLSHCVTLLLFLSTRYEPSWPTILKNVFLSRSANQIPPPPPSVSHLAYILVTCNFIGVFFARSLHYQFLAWYHWTLPVLLYFSRMPFFAAIPWYIAHEYCWNSYPPNSKASTLLFLLNASLLLLVYFPQSEPVPNDESKKN